MIIVDYSAIAIAAIFSQERPEDINEGLIRHMILNSIRRINSSFRNEYGQLVVAVDSKSWRKEYFPQYKAARKKYRDESQLDWPQFFTHINTVRDELNEFFPYPVVTTPGAEADDVIGQLVFSTQEFGKNEPVMIVSSDKDFFQLHRFSNVKQFSPMKRQLVDIDDPHYFLFEHICKGDTGDGVPNILSGDDTFVSEQRQKPLRSKLIESWYELKDGMESAVTADVWRNYIRNRSLINLEYTPKHIGSSILDRYYQNCNKSNSHVLNYLIEKRCNMLVSSVDDFLKK